MRVSILSRFAALVVAIAILSTAAQAQFIFPLMEDARLVRVGERFYLEAQNQTEAIWALKFQTLLYGEAAPGDPWIFIPPLKAGERFEISVQDVPTVARPRPLGPFWGTLELYLFPRGQAKYLATKFTYPLNSEDMTPPFGPKIRCQDEVLQLEGDTVEGVLCLVDASLPSVTVDGGFPGQAWVAQLGDGPPVRYFFPYSGLGRQTLPYLMSATVRDEFGRCSTALFQPRRGAVIPPGRTGGFSAELSQLNWRRVAQP